MAHRIRWLNQALRELYHRCQFLEPSSTEHAFQLEEEAFRAAEMLERFLVLGRVVPDLSNEHRCLLIAKRTHWPLYRT